MPTNPAPRKQNDRHIADQAVTLPTKTSIPVCTFDDVFNRRFNDGQHTDDAARAAADATEQRARADAGHEQASDARAAHAAMIAELARCPAMRRGRTSPHPDPADRPTRRA